VRVYVDTNILIAASIQAHPQHPKAFALINSIKEGELEGFVSGHGLAEFYSVLTRAPFVPRILAAEAGRILEDNIVPYFHLVTLDGRDYQDVLFQCSRTGLTGGIVYDALHLHCARKAECDRIYTLNLRDFRSIVTDDLRAKICSL